MLIRLLLLALAAYLVWLLLIWLYQERLIFPGMLMRRAGDTVPRPAAAEVFWIERGPTRVEAWLTPPLRAEAGPWPLVVHAHGNAELIDEMAWLLEPYRAWGFAVLQVEYPGFARSTGVPGQAGVVEDVLAAIDRVAADGRIDGDLLVYHGRSIGGAVMAQVAARRPPRVMILESTFTHLGAFCARYGAPAFLLRHPFRTDAVLQELDRPVLILHGERDTIVPHSHGVRLESLARDATLVSFPAGHNDFPVGEAPYWRAIEGFLRTRGLLAGP